MKINEVKVGVEYAFSSYGAPSGRPTVFLVTDIVTEAETIHTYSWQRGPNGESRTRNVRKVKGIRREYGSEDGREVITVARYLYPLQEAVDRYHARARGESLAEELGEAIGLGYVSSRRSWQGENVIEVTLSEDEAKALLARLGQ